MNSKEILSLVEKQCSIISISPEDNISSLIPLLKKYNTPLLIPIYFQLFSTLLPLYKIKIIEDKVKHCNQYERLKNYDKNLLDAYRSFINILLKSDTYESFKAAAELLSSFDHFNLVEKLIKKILVGTKSKQRAIKNICMEILAEKLKTSSDISLKIVERMMELKFHPDVLKNLQTLYKSDNEEFGAKIREACLRLCLFILRNKKENFIKESLECLANFYLPLDLKEGTLVLLNDYIHSDDKIISLYAVRAIASLYSKEKFSLENAIKELIKLIVPFSKIPKDVLSHTLELLFINRDQGAQIVSVVVNKLLSVAISEYSEEIMSVLSKIIMKFKIDLNDEEEKFYCADLYKKIFSIYDR